MSKEKDIFKTGQTDFAFDVLQKYVEGTLSVPETRLLERAMIDDPFLADAVDGLMAQNAAQVSKIVNEINSEILAPKRGKLRALWIPMSLAASLIVGFVVLYQTLPTSNSKMEASSEVLDSVASTQSEPAIAIQDSTQLPLAVNEIQINSPIADETAPCPPSPVAQKSSTAQKDEFLAIENEDSKGQTAQKMEELVIEAPVSKEKLDSRIGSQEGESSNLSSKPVIAQEDKIAQEMILIAEKKVFNGDNANFSKKEIARKASKEDKKKDCKDCPKSMASYEDAAERAVLTKEVAMNKYKNKLYGEAKPLFESILKQYPQDELAKNMLDLCRLQLGETVFVNENKNKLSKNLDLSRWLKAVLYIQQGETQNAKKELEEISSQNGPFKNDAILLLPRLGE